jgi:energy-coupling factor transporter ATP-binding protein EcfA2
VSDVLSILKAEHGLEAKTQLRPIPLAKEHIGSATVHESKIVLKELRELKSVNAIPCDTSLKFGETGVTVIYGDNASGKSGYSRVLKKACRARGTQEKIHPNIFSGQSSTSPAEASFIIDCDGQEGITLKWKDGEESSPKELANIAVFDTGAARVYIDSKNAAHYQPYGIDVFPTLAELHVKLQGLLRSEIDGLPVPDSVISELVGEDRIIKTVDASTDVKKLQGKAEWSESDNADLMKAKRAVAELVANDPKKKAQELRSAQTRIDSIRKSLTRFRKNLQSKEKEHLRDLCTKTRDAGKALLASSKEVFDTEPLAGAGSEVWKRLFLAAKDFSRTHAYPEKEFPVVDIDSKCVLCHQALSEEAKERMLRFNKHISEHVSRFAAETRQALEKATNELKASTHGISNEQVNEVADYSAELAEELRKSITSLENRKEEILSAIDNDQWDRVAGLPSVPWPALSKLSKDLGHKAEKSDALIDPEKSKQITANLVSLELKKKLYSKMDILIAHVRTLATEKLLGKCMAALNTTKITNKQKEVMKTVLTDRLKGALLNEMKELGVSHVQLQLDSSGSRGTTYHKLSFSGATKNAGISDVLSEGEQRAVAIASFLSELGSSEHECGIIFDDPVSSLDHVWRERVAKRLVKEGLKRQVIIFTHEIHFLVLLLEMSNQMSVQLTLRHLFTRNNQPGFVDNDQPEITMSARKRVGYLRCLHQEATKCFKESDDKEYRFRGKQVYQSLRKAWERTVEEVLLNNVIRRFSKEVNTQSLREVSVEEQDYKDIEIGMTECSNWMHDPPADSPSKFPDPDQIVGAIDLLDGFITRVNKRRAETKAKRPKKLRI